MKNLELAKTTLLDNNYSLVVVKEDKIIHQSTDHGLKPLIDLYMVDKSKLKDAYIADKVIGKAAALILGDANIKALYAELISTRAISVLEEANISYDYTNKVEEIRNRTNTGMCPMEELSLDSTSADELIIKIKEKFNI